MKKDDSLIKENLKKAQCRVLIMTSLFVNDVNKINLTKTITHVHTIVYQTVV